MKAGLNITLVIHLRGLRWRERLKLAWIALWGGTAELEDFIQGVPK